MAKRPTSIDDRKRMTFRQAEGLEKLPSALNWGELDDDIRLLIWDAYYEFIEKGKNYRAGIGYLLDEDTFEYFKLICRNHFRLPMDEASEMAGDVELVSDTIKKIILETDVPEVLELVQTSLRTRKCTIRLGDHLKRAMESTRSPYLIVDNPPTIIPRGSEEEGETAKRDLQTIADSEFAGARSHLISAAEALNNADARGAIRESIHAVESATKRITGKEGATLPDCLKLLKKERELHPALEMAFQKLYAYTSDEKGIRHALTEGDNEKVATDEALFMFSACTAFVSYLARKFPEQS